MSTSAEQLLVRIDATTEQLRREMRRGDQAVDQHSRRMGQSLRRVDNSFSRLNRSVRNATRVLGMFGVALSGAAMVRFARSAIEAANEIDKAAQTAGIARESVQELRFAFGQLADVTDNQVDQALQRFNRRLGEAQAGSAQYSAALQQLGVDARTQTEPALNQVIEALQQVENDAERASLASRLFGDRVGPQLAGALQAGNRSIRQLREDARQLGIVLDEDMIKGAAETADQFDRMSRVLGVRFQRIILDNTDQIMTLASAMETLVGWIATAIEKFVDLGEAIGSGAGQMAVQMDMDRISRQISMRHDEIDDLQRQMQETSTALAEGRIRDETAAQSFISDSRARVMELREEIERLSAQYESLINLDQKTVTRPPPPPTVAAGGELGAVEVSRPGTLTDLEIQVQEQRELNAALRESEEQYRHMRRQIEIQNDIQAFRNQLIEDEAENVDSLVAEYAQQRMLMSALEEDYESMNAATEGLNQAAVDLGFTFSSAFEDAIIRGDELRSVLRGMLDDINRILLRVTVTGPLADGIAAGVSGMFGGERAMGGPVRAGQSYLVGERGPELVTMGASGFVTPNHRMQGGQVVVNNNIDARGAEPGVEEKIMRAMEMTEQRTIAQIRKMQQSRGNSRI